MSAYFNIEYEKLEYDIAKPGLEDSVVMGGAHLFLED
jgi:hypothetical protein